MKKDVPQLPTFEPAAEKDPGEVSFHSMKYYKKLTLRDKCEGMNPMDFVMKEEFKEMHIWDLKYVSTSDDEDNDSDVKPTDSEESSSEEESSEDEQEEG